MIVFFDRLILSLIEIFRLFDASQWTPLKFIGWIAPN